MILHREVKCQCDVTPLRMFNTGEGGTGKSFLIKALMMWSYVQSNDDDKGADFLLGAPTGIAAHAINGQTLHSLFGLPVEKEKAQLKYVALNDMVRSQFQAMYKSCIGFIIDEVHLLTDCPLTPIFGRLLSMVS